MVGATEPSAGAPGGGHSPGVLATKLVEPSSGPAHDDPAKSL